MIEIRKISGMAIRQCVELGYHRSTEKYRFRADALSKEISKRCFWVAYDLDCVASFILGRPKGIPDIAIDVEVSPLFARKHLNFPGSSEGNSYLSTLMTRISPSVGFYALRDHHLPSLEQA